MRITGILLAVIVMCAGLAQPAVAAVPYLDDDTIPGKPLGADQLGWAQKATDESDVFRVWLMQGETLTLNLDGPNPPNDLDLYLHGPSAEDFGGPVVAVSATSSSDETLEYTAVERGWHYLRVYVFSGEGEYLLQSFKWWKTPHGDAERIRVAGGDRYSTAVAIARETFPSWKNLDHVIIASGEDRAAADPLAASGLVWTYGAPILLVRSATIPADVMQALKEIRAANGPLTVHIVGGPVSVTQAVLDQISSQVSNVTFDRVGPYSNRYELASSIARRAIQERPGEAWGGPFAGCTLIANGEDPAKFFDALALSPVAAASGYPILLVRRDSIPVPTRAVIEDFSLLTKYVAGGPNTVSESVFDQLDGGAIPGSAFRWSGSDRYATAAAVTSKASTLFNPTLIWPSNVGVAAKLPDALSGGAMMGLRGGGILITRATSVPTPTYQFLHANTEYIGSCAAFGGINSIADGVLEQINDALAN